MGFMAGAPKHLGIECFPGKLADEPSNPAVGLLQLPDLPPGCQGRQSIAVLLRGLSWLTGPACCRPQCPVGYPGVDHPDHLRRVLVGAAIQPEASRSTGPDRIGPPALRRTFGADRMGAGRVSPAVRRVPGGAFDRVDTVHPIDHLPEPDPAGLYFAFSPGIGDLGTGGAVLLVCMVVL